MVPAHHPRFAFVLLLGLAACGGVNVQRRAEAVLPGTASTTNDGSSVAQSLFECRHHGGAVCRTRAGCTGSRHQSSFRAAARSNLASLQQAVRLRHLRRSRARNHGWRQVVQGVPKSDGTLERGVNLNQGTWTVNSSVEVDGPSYQLLAEAAGTITGHPAFSVDPLKMFIKSFGGSAEATYVGQGEKLRASVEEVAFAATCTRRWRAPLRVRS